MNEARVGLAVVDAAYRLDLPHKEWLTALARAASPVLDDGLGVLAMTFHSSSSGELRVTSDMASVGGVTRELIEVVTEGMSLLRPSEVSAIHANPRVALATHSDMARQNPVVRPPSELWLSPRALAIGCRDSLAAKTLDPSGQGCMIFSILRRERRTASAARARWRMVMTHVAAAMRLRNALRDEEGDAVLTPDGHVVHAQSETVRKSARSKLREAAVAIDRAKSRAGTRDPDAALAGWRGLVDGRWSLVDHFDRDGRRFLVARRNDPSIRAPSCLSMRERQVLAYSALGFSNKHIAYALGLAHSTVSTHLRAGMRRLGIHNRAALVDVFRSSLKGEAS